MPGPPGPDVELIFFTDPLCSWSWAFEPHRRRLLLEFEGRVGCRVVMGGMIPDWGSYSDPMNSVHAPGQMGPQWSHVRQVTGMPIVDRLWADDPPSSSYPACLAAKAAELQGTAAGEAYLRRLREAAMLELRNTSRTEVLLCLADELADEPEAAPGFDPDRFRDDLTGPEAAEAFREDLRETKRRDVGRFPTLILRKADGRGAIVVGYRPHDALQAALSHVAPDLMPHRRMADAIGYATRWGRVLDHEVALALGIEIDAARRALDDASAAGHLERIDPDPAIGRSRGDGAHPARYRARGPRP